MDKKIVVVALGHRALGTTLPEQKKATKESAKAIADLVEAGAEVVITHSNAPQVGMIHTAMNEFGKNHEDFTVAPMSVCSAMSQGYIGYDLQNAIRAELVSRGIYKPVATVLTQVKVNIYDEAFYEPTKVIGRCMSKEEAEEEEKKGNFVVETENGYRRIVAAPKPQAIIEIDTIKALVDAGQIVIACGGGGIPVLEQGVELRGASAVIEKDLTSGKIAELLNAHQLLILTSVDQVALDYQSDHEVKLGHITVEEAKKYMAENQFEAGSMLPKFEAAISFIEKGVGRQAVITSLDLAKAGFRGKAGTVISQ
ncbi:MAG: carbamate kinase [Lachnospiraceae bacterium]|nr:carbamate kinase [Lachnospiraceae bacterium]MDD3617474.1 carbamate kinase [Lachnospiraceae bacterium]